MNRKLLKTIEWLFFIVAGFILLLAILLTVARFTFPQFSRYQPQIASWASKELGQPVKIGGLDAAWIGLTPSFGFKNISLLDKSTQKPMLTIRHFYIKLNLLSSLIHWQVVPSQINLDGVSFTVAQQSRYDYKVNGYDYHLGDQHNQSGDSQMKSFFDWMLKQQEVSLRHVNINWQPKEGQAHEIRNLRLLLENSLLHHRLMGAVIVNQKQQPTKVNWIINFSGNLFANPQFKADFYLKARNISLENWLSNKAYFGVVPKQGIGDISAWGRFEGQDLVELHAVPSLSDFVLQSSVTGKPIKFNHLAGNFLWQKVKAGWVLAANQVNIGFQNQTWPENKFSFRYQPQADNQPAMQILAAKDIELAGLRRFLLGTELLPKAEYDWLERLKPTGNIRNLMLKHIGAPNQLGQLSISAGFEKLGISRWHKIPGVSNLTGWVNITPKSGQALINSQAVKLDFGDMFLAPIQFDQLSGSATWDGLHSSNWQLQVKQLNFANQNLAVNTDLILKNSENGPVLNLLGSYHLTNFAKAKDFMPFGIMKPKLADWLRAAFVSGTGIQGTVVFRGPLDKFPFDQQQGVFIVDGDFNNLEFDFNSDWPNIDGLSGNVVFQNRSMTVLSHSGSLMGSAIKTVAGNIPDLDKPVLSVDGDVTGDTSQGMMFVHNSPLEKKLGKSLAGFALSGPMSLKLKLKIPMTGTDRHDEVSGDVSLIGAKIAVPDLKIAINNVNGDFTFTDDGLYAKKLTGEFMNAPMTIQIDTKQDQKKSSTTTVKMAGRFDAKTLKEMYHLNFLQGVSGTSDFSGQYDIHQQDGSESDLLTLNSDLKGIIVDLPAPFGKKADVPEAFKFTMRPLKTKLLLSIDWKNKLAGLFDFHQIKKNWDLKEVKLLFGGGEPTLSSKTGLYLEGRLSSFDWALWQPYINRFFKKGDDKGTDDLPLRQIRLSAKTMKAEGIELTNATVDLQPAPNVWAIDIDSDNVVGKVNYFFNRKKPLLQARLNKLFYISSKSKHKETVNPADLPQFDVVINDLQFDNRHFGAVELETEPTQSGLRIDHLIVESPIAYLNAAGSWQNSPHGQITRVYGRFETNNLGSALSQWHVTSSLANGKGNAAFTLAWLGSPMSPRIESLDGKLSLAFQDGRIINIGEKAQAEMGLGKVLNLLSLQTLPRRLHLDFSDLTKKGFSFDSMQGNFDFKRGNAYTKDFDLNGPVADVRAQGRIGFKQKDYDFELTVVPHITSSLPIIATIAGGPIAGAVTWVANKVFGREISKIAESKYHVVGSWVKPEFIELPAPTYNHERQSP